MKLVARGNMKTHSEGTYLVNGEPAKDNRIVNGTLETLDTPVQICSWYDTTGNGTSSPVVIDPYSKVEVHVAFKGDGWSFAEIHLTLIEGQMNYKV